MAHREKLVNGLLDYNKHIGNSQKALNEIEKLKDSRSSVVIGGQQAGILTGPLYSIHKAVTILQLARQKEQELGIPVIPVYWIAGEDHDYDEVNHVFVQNREGGVKRIRLQETPEGRMSISHFEISEDAIGTLIEEFFASQNQTEYTADLKRKLYDLATISPTLTDFFARTMAWLFGQEGLVLVDAALPFMRELEKEGFRDVILRNKELSEAVMSQSENMIAAGYHRQVETDSRHAQFFLYVDGKRVGVLRNEDGTFQAGEESNPVTAEELLLLLEEDSERFSANVVTRPYMQERIFPTLAFVGGPGEIAYWGLYNQYFEVFGMELPILAPRLTFTFLEGVIQKNMRKYELTVSDIFNGLEEKKEEILRSLQTFQYEKAFSQVRDEIEGIYKGIIQQTSDMDAGLQKIGQKNMEKVLEQVGYFEKKTGEAFLKKNEALIRQFDRMHLTLFPLDKPQERVYNIFGYLNKYGFQWFESFLGNSYTYNPLHKIVFI